LPVESNGIALDRAATELLSFAEVVRETTPEHQRAIVNHILEKVTITDRQVTDIAVRLKARPFFSDLTEGEADEWRWRPRTGAGRELHRAWRRAWWPSPSSIPEMRERPAPRGTSLSSGGLLRAG
jgi:hypothetical protein